MVGWLFFFSISIIRFFAVLKGRHGDGVRRLCVCVRSVHPWGRGGVCWWGRKSSNFPAICQLFCLQGKSSCMFRHVLKILTDFKQVEKTSFFLSKIRMEWAIDIERFLSNQSPIKVNPSKWEHREKSNGDVALKAYYAGTFHSSIPYGKILLPLSWFLSLFPCGVVTFS